MNLKHILILFLLVLSSSIFAQQSVNNYKYIVVSKKFNFLKSEDQYQLNSLTKFLFKKEGFYAIFDNEIRPEELAINSCLGLTSKVKNNSGMFRTKLIIELVNCKNEIVFTSKEGISKQKDYKKAYQEALRDAFTSLTTLNYKYNPTGKSAIKRKEVFAKEDKPNIKVVDNSVKKEELVKEEVAVKEEVVDVEEVPFKVIEKVSPLKEEKIEKAQKSEKVEKVKTPSNLLYAQPNEMGYQLVDSSPKVVYILIKSSKEDLYFLKNKNGIVFKERGKWFVEYYNGKTKVKDVLHIKF